MNGIDGAVFRTFPMKHTLEGTYVRFSSESACLFHALVLLSALVLMPLASQLSRMMQRCTDPSRIAADRVCLHTAVAFHSGA